MPKKNPNDFDALIAKITTGGRHRAADQKPATEPPGSEPLSDDALRDVLGKCTSASWAITTPNGEKEYLSPGDAFISYSLSILREAGLEVERADWKRAGVGGDPVCTLYFRLTDLVDPNVPGAVVPVLLDEVARPNDYGSKALALLVSDSVAWVRFVSALRELVSKSPKRDSLTAGDVSEAVGGFAPFFFPWTPEGSKRVVNAAKRKWGPYAPTSARNLASRAATRILLESLESS